MPRIFSRFRRAPVVADTAPWPEPDRPATDIVVSRARRVARLRVRLAEDGVAWPEPITADGAPVVLDALDAWTWRHWRGHMRFDDLDPLRFHRAPWPDGAVGGQFTAVADVGFAIADVVQALRPDLVWAVDHYVGHAVDGVETSGKVVLVDPQLPLDATDPEVVDPFGTALLRAMQAALDDRAPEPLRNGLRPLLWFTHRHLFA